MRIEISKNGTSYSFPASVVAMSRARYYALKDGTPDTKEYRAAFNEEFDIAMRDESELVDWARNSMDPEDISIENRKLTKAGSVPTFEECWSSDDEWEVVD